MEIVVTIAGLAIAISLLYLVYLLGRRDMRNDCQEVIMELGKKYDSLEATEDPSIVVGEAYDAVCKVNILNL